MKCARVDEIPGKIWPLGVIFEKILQEGDHMESFPQRHPGPLGHVAAQGAEVIVIREAVQVDENLDLVALLQESRREILVG